MVKIVEQITTESSLKRKARKNLERKRSIIRCVMIPVDYADKPDVASRPGFVWVREYSKSTENFGGVFPVFNPTSERRINMPVFVGPSPRSPFTLQVLGVDFSILSTLPGTGDSTWNMQNHGHNHTYIPGTPSTDYSTDVADMTERNLIACRVFPTTPASMKVKVARG
jgi:hypothetical protein